jgi:hypothetical protein
MGKRRAGVNLTVLTTKFNVAQKYCTGGGEISVRKEPKLFFVLLSFSGGEEAVTRNRKLSA